MIRPGIEFTVLGDSAVGAQRLFLHGWRYIVQKGRVVGLDIEGGCFLAFDAPARRRDRCGSAAMKALRGG